MDAEAWVALGFLCFVGAFIYLGAHSKIAVALDARGRRIRAELDEAERLRKEAADLLASFEGKRQQAERDAAEIVEQARAEAEQMSRDAEIRMNDFLRRRTAQAEAKIGNAEVQALAQVRGAAADAAVAAAKSVLQNGMGDNALADRLFDQGLADVKRLKETRQAQH